MSYCEWSLQEGSTSQCQVFSSMSMFPIVPWIKLRMFEGPTSLQTPVHLHQTANFQQMPTLQGFLLYFVTIFLHPNQSQGRISLTSSAKPPTGYNQRFTGTTPACIPCVSIGAEGVTTSKKQKTYHWKRMLITDRHHMTSSLQVPFTQASSGVGKV